jgi:hypothetical protein
MKKSTMIALAVAFAIIAALSFYSATSHARTLLPEPTVWFQPLPVVCGMHTEYQTGGGMYPYPVFNVDKPILVAGCSYAWLKNLANLIDYIREVNIRPELESGNG